MRTYDYNNLFDRVMTPENVLVFERIEWSKRCCYDDWSLLKKVYGHYLNFI